MNLVHKALYLALIALSITSCKNTITEPPTDMDIPENPIPACPESPNCFRITQVFEMNPETVFKAFENSISNENPFEFKADKITVNSSISAVYKIPVFGWLDDVKLIFEADKDNKNNTFVHLKSSSREGYSDLGVNKRRIKRILKKARKELNL